MRTSRFLAVVPCLLLGTAFAHARDLQVASAWAPAPAKIDGTAQSWAPLLRPLGEVPMEIGVQNDADFLYLCLKTSDLKIKKQLANVGLTVWANGTGKTSKGFGVRFPIREGPRGMRPQGEAPAPPPLEEASGTVAVRPATEFELIGPAAEDRLRVKLGGDEPVAAAFGDDSGVTVLELRIPLKSSDVHPLAIGAVPGTVIALGLETERPKASEGRGEKGSEGRGGEPGGMPPGGGFGGGRGGGYGAGPGGGYGGYGGGHHGRGGGTGEGMRGMPSPIKMWLHVTLATPPPPPAAK